MAKPKLSYTEAAKVVAKDFLTNSQEAKAVKAVAKSTLPAKAVAAGRSLANKAKGMYDIWKYDGAPPPGSKEEAEYVAGMGAKAWAKEKKKAGIKD